MLAKFAEDDRIEQMNAQKRRMKQLEHKRAVEQLLDDRRAQFVAEREREIEEKQEAEKMEGFRRQLIEEERQKLLREHAQKLLGYLPKVRQLLKLFVVYHNYIIIFYLDRSQEAILPWSCFLLLFMNTYNFRMNNYLYFVDAFLVSEQAVRNILISHTYRWVS